MRKTRQPNNSSLRVRLSYTELGAICYNQPERFLASDVYRSLVDEEGDLMAVKNAMQDVM
jgi:hypothetical protein